MTHRFASPIAHAATALVLLGACSDDGPTTLAKGDDVELVGDENLAGQTLDIRAEDEDGEVTGELRFTDVSGEVVVAVECADTETDGVVILGGDVAESTGDAFTGRIALILREGDPDGVAVWTDPEPGSCTEILDDARENALDDDNAFDKVESGDLEFG